MTYRRDVLIPFMKAKELSKEKQEKDIRCKCGKYWGMRNHQKTCRRCKTTVIARGNNDDKELEWKMKRHTKRPRVT